MYKKVNVVMLPTNVSKRYNCTEGLIVKCIKSWTPIGEAPIEIDKLFISKNWSKGVLYYYECQHLYIISDEEVKEGDWFAISKNKVVQCQNCLGALGYTRDIDNAFIYIVSKYHNKIIATTDTSLRLPQLPQKFIELYCQKYNEGNPITEVMVEYEIGECKCKDIELFGECINQFNTCIKSKLKINSDNTINIKPTKDSWTREEVIALCRSAHLHGEQGALNLHNQVFKQWIEENL